MTPFSVRLHKAMDLAALAHRDQFRKDPDIQLPYVAHAYAVAYLLAEHDCSEEAVVAGLLHDVLEDRPSMADAVAEFGETVLSLVRQVSEREKYRQGEKLPWRDRKAAYIEHIRAASPEAKAISCADKIHNMQSMLLALSRGADIFAQLAAPWAEQVARFEVLREALADGWVHPLLARYDTVLDALRQEVAKHDDSENGSAP
ncbi:MAG: bifunctional (p)ppGpp synthetase/guanosine-3',5'-bis(diphosphate) 3'-pyrophosphohydrolase [Armatimonadetes bacterium]|nr:bifunctional (p)ppGpp synthetase/guanosine-3',5'-bis(diphosphate) 3'-pyrophosphohydrolase [Armatimonadota bacterium]NCO96322.1 bifunctional (p)ppGpp synthetase/guanosine-3',5'-bis(diphosphate) 3'-pyrophosphohydrolase [Armatimonadota bacterium]NCP34706.1 bifunctional (p)ppGpp synthetase/guanosine-3',5'-bis(diphosphate) 3'-pyrophosphohydrolase [Armatimonadota bacterium]NCQ27616.1 bifunctional (p)ppGpp synthetase/guanosine-3',5'-bis(diphosphate) 3'-pyrophosphohydrolase [Armatimonadota bacterium]